LTGAEEKLRIH